MVEFDGLRTRLGIELPSETLLPALVHGSAAVNNPDLADNERLEYLGDAVLDLAVAELLYRAYPDRSEGELSKLRGVIVSRPTLAEKARELELGRYLVLGKGEDLSGGRDRSSILAAAMEAILGVVFLECGYPAARALAEHLFGAEIERVGKAQNEDYKSLLQELGHRRYGCAPEYRTVESAGPEHRKVFTVEAELGEHRVLGRGKSKKEAEQAAAKRLFIGLTESS